MNILLSYPRSGNGLTRTILEYITRHTVIDENPSVKDSIIADLDAFQSLNVKENYVITIFK